MKRNVILVVNAEPETASALAAVASGLHLDVRFISDGVAVSQLEQALADVDGIVLDIDHGRGAGFIAPDVVWDTVTLPMLIVSSYDKSWIEPFLGGTDPSKHSYLSKPVSSHELELLLRHLLNPEDGLACICERQGHPCANCSRQEVTVEPEEMTTLTNN